MNTTKIEVCIESVESARVAQNAGADRVELCAALTEGGITPSYGVVSAVRKAVRIGVNVIIRPRRGDFFYSDDEFECMRSDIEILKNLGVDGFVFGILTPDGKVDIERNRALIEAARPFSTTFHRAFDAVEDPFKALESCIELGFDRILTSGLESKAEAGIPLLKQLVEQAADRIVIMPGSGVGTSNAVRILEATSATEIHLSAKERYSCGMNYRKEEVPMSNSAPLSEYELERTSASILGEVVKMVKG